MCDANRLLGDTYTIAFFSSRFMSRVCCHDYYSFRSSALCRTRKVVLACADQISVQPPDLFPPLEIAASIAGGYPHQAGGYLLGRALQRREETSSTLAGGVLDVRTTWVLHWIRLPINS